MILTEDNHTYQFKVYLAPSYGLGVFTKEFIKKGSVVWKSNKDWATLMDEQEYLSSPYKHFVYQSKETEEYILLRDISRYENHSDDPNVVDSIAVRDILPGEEITGDYKSYDLRWKEKLSISSQS